MTQYNDTFSKCSWLEVRENRSVTAYSEVSWIHISKIDRIFYREGEEFDVKVESNGVFYLLNSFETKKEADACIKQVLADLEG